MMSALFFLSDAFLFYQNEEFPGGVLLNLVGFNLSGDPAFVSLYCGIVLKQEEDQRKWIENLRVMGFKAAHPNDGWVNRGRNEVFLAYPQFNDGAGEGDLVMLGWPWDKESWRPIKLTGKRETSVGKMVWWGFEDVPSEEYVKVPMPEKPRPVSALEVLREIRTECIKSGYWHLPSMSVADALLDSAKEETDA